MLSISFNGITLDLRCLYDAFIKVCEVNGRDEFAAMSYEGFKEMFETDEKRYREKIIRECCDGFPTSFATPGNHISLEGHTTYVDIDIPGRALIDSDFELEARSGVRSLRDVHPAFLHQLAERFEVNLPDANGDCALDGDAWVFLISDMDVLGDIVRRFGAILYGPFRSAFLDHYGLTVAQFSELFMIPLRTVQEWASGKNECRQYLRLLFAQTLGEIHYFETENIKNRREK